MKKGELLLILGVGIFVLLNLPMVPFVKYIPKFMSSVAIGLVILGAVFLAFERRRDL